MSKEETITTVFKADTREIQRELDDLIAKAGVLNRAVNRRHSTLTILAEFTAGIIIGLFATTLLL